MREWVPIGELFHPSRNEKSLSEYRRQLIQGIEAGLIEARSFRSRKKFAKFDPADDLEIFSVVARREILGSCSFPWTHDWSDRGTDEPTKIESHNFALSSASLTSSEAWQCSAPGEMPLKQTKTDWERGHFSWRMLAYHRDGEGWGHVGFSYSSEDLFAVEIDAEAVRKIIGWQVAEAGDPIARTTKYDWEAAFAFVAARFFHDEEFEDVNARGVQARVAELLLDSFEKRKVALPSAESCKKKASIIVGELRATSPKLP